MIGSIRFAGDLPVWAVIGFAVFVATGVAWFYLRESRSVSAPYNYLLPGLRASAIALVILILAGPVWHRRVMIGTLGRVVFAVDVSQSMSTTDSAESESMPSRLDRVRRLLQGDTQLGDGSTISGGNGWLGTLSETHEIDVVAFASDEPSVIWSSRNEQPSDLGLDLSASGSRTNLSSPLSLAQTSVATKHFETDQDGSQREALVLISDGRGNMGRSPVDVAEQLKSAGLVVHAIGMGSEDEPDDVGIARVERPDSVASDGKLAGRVVLHHTGMSGRDAIVRIESGPEREVVWQKTVKANAAFSQEIPFEIEVEPIVEHTGGDTPRGVRRSTVVLDLRASVQPIEGDTNPQNNVVSFRIAASTRDRKLLILDGSSRWEMRYLRNLFERDPAWSVETLLYGPGTDSLRVRRGIGNGQFPNTREAMSAYDAIVLGEVPPEQFEPNDAELLREFVTRGGGLVVIDGRYGRLAKIAQTSLAELIPVRHLGGTFANIQSVRPTPMGIEHPILNLWGDKEELAEFWENLPAPASAVHVEAREGAEVWAEIVATDQSETPWLVTRLFGGGRVFYLSADQTWRWRYKVADRFHARFWNQLMAAVMQPPYSASDNYVALGTNKIEYEVGESSTIRARLQDSGGQPIPDATVDALLVSENRVVATVPLAVDDPARGTYIGQSAPLPSGAFEIRIRASGFDANALQATTPIWVGTQDTVELSRISLDRNALAQIANAGGGAYVHESSADELLEKLKPLSSGTVIESDILIWQSYYWFIAVMILLTIEWWMRKRAGLV